MQLSKVFGLFCILGISALAQAADADKDGKIEKQTLGTETTTILTTEYYINLALVPTPVDFFNKKPVVTSTTSSTTTKLPKHTRTLVTSSSTSWGPKHTRTLVTSSSTSWGPKHTRTLVTSSSTSWGPKHTRTLVTSSSTSWGPKHTRILPMTRLPPTLHSDTGEVSVDANELSRRAPDCIAVCIENALVFVDCAERSQDCVCNDVHYQKVLYHCLTAVCESEQLPSAVEFITDQCFPYLTPNEEGEFVLFRDTEVHGQEGLHHLYARKHYGSGTVSGARPAGPTSPPTYSYKHLLRPWVRPRPFRAIRDSRDELQGASGPASPIEGTRDVAVVVTTIVTEYVDASSRPTATEGSQNRKRSEKKSP